MTTLCVNGIGTVLVTVFLLYVVAFRIDPSNPDGTVIEVLDVLGHNWFESVGASVTAAVLFVLILAGLKRVKRIRPIQEARNPLANLALDIAYGFLWSWSAVVVYFTLVCLFLPEGPPVYREVAAFGWAYLVASSVALFVAYDLWAYVTHRFFHIPVMWKLAHGIHHTATTPRLTSQFRNSPIEPLAKAFFVLVWINCIPTHASTLLALSVVMLIKATADHCGYEVYPAFFTRPGRFKIIPTVAHHDLHHSSAGVPCNFGLFTTLWDRLFGTYLEPVVAGREDAVSEAMCNR